MWQYNNVRFIYSNEVGSVFNQQGSFPHVYTYIKSKYALMQALRMMIESSYLGPYTDVDPRTVKFDKPIKV